MTPGRPRLSPRFFPSPCLLLTFVTFPLTDADLHSFFASLLLCYNIKLRRGYVHIDFYGIRRGARGYRRRAAGGAMVSNLVGGDAAMIELEQLVAGYDGVAITPPLSGMICPGSLT
ncbi:metal ABC transporter ATP-binding protein, partial [Klebsiella pneumoniae]